MNPNTKIRNFVWLAAVAVGLLGVAGLSDFWLPAPQAWTDGATGQSAAQSWDAGSVAPEPKFSTPSSIKLTPFPPLPDENKTIDFKPLPKRLPKFQSEPPQFAAPQIDIRSTDFETINVELAGSKTHATPATHFSDLPAMGNIQTRTLPALPTPPSDGSPEEATANNGLARPATSANPQEPAWEIRSLPPQNKIKFKRLPTPQPNLSPSLSQGQAATGMTEAPALGRSNRLPMLGQLSIPTSKTAWSHPDRGPVIELATAEFDLSETQGPPVIPDISLDESLVGNGELAGTATQVLGRQPTAKVARLPKTSAGKKKKKKVVVAPQKGSKPNSGADGKQNSKDDYTLAAQPELGAHYIQDKPQTDQCAHVIEPLVHDFSPDAVNPLLPYEPHSQMNVYQGKTLNANQRPLVELGRPWYQLGQLSPGSSVLGFHNNVTPQFLVFGDYRTGYAFNNQNGNSTSQIATQLNLDFDLKLTGTERFHAFVQPLSSGGRNTRRLLDDDEMIFEGSANPAFGYFEGDLGAMVGGAINKTLPFDLPFAAGIIPLVFQNGVWFEDAILGFAATLPAKNSPRFNISNMDVTFFAGYDKLDSPAFQGDDSAARIMGIASFLEMLNGYVEIDYAFLDDRTFADRSYHNIGIGYTRRYGRFVSNSTRVIVNAGQNSAIVGNTADGVLLLSENSLITGFPSNVVPYFNFFAGFDRPQSAARAGIAGGVLRNTGILFESDNLTGYPTLDATANDTFGMSLGVEVLSGGDRFSQQLVLETSMLGVMGDARTRNAAGDQYGVGFRYQLPLSNSVIFRADGMAGFLRGAEDISGIRLEVRKKF